MLVTLADGEPAGALLTMIEKDRQRVRTLNVAQPVQKRDIGAWALGAAIAEAQAAGLTVLITNPTRRFYE
ncbi:hypothetical protein [Aquibium carbonis]|nr:hypothetical protein [Aquibium carbonis]